MVIDRIQIIAIVLSAMFLLGVLELVRRRELRATQKTLFGPIVLEPAPGTQS